VVPDIAGPRVRLGVVWFTAAVAAAATSRLALAALLALAAAAAADELSRIHLGRRRLPIPVAAATLPLGALGGARGLLAAAVGATVALAVVRLLTPSGPPAIMELSVGLTAALALGTAAASPVLVARFGAGAAVTMVVLVSAYEVGDFLVGTGAAARWEGPMAGVVAVGVCAFAVWVVDIAPLHRDGVVAMAAVVGGLGPLGPPAGTVLLGSEGQAGRYVRRLDTLLVAGPIAAWVVARALLPS
jgi:hypothetical protein